MSTRGLLYLVVFTLLFAAGALNAEDGAAAKKPKKKGRVVATDPQALTICGQNLENYGPIEIVRRRSSKVTPETLSAKEISLIKRFMIARCDIIAVQEVLGNGQDEAQRSLEGLATQILRRTGRKFNARVGASGDKYLHNGFLVAADRAEILHTVSYSNVELPKLTEKQKPRLFSRGPVEVQLELSGGEGSLLGGRRLVLVNFHFKSKAGAGRDAAGVEWETYRMEAAEGLRRILANRFTPAFASGETLLVVLGDRNSHRDTASAKILEGSLTLANFQGEAVCRLSKRGAPLCRTESRTPQKLFSVLTGDPHTVQRHGTYVYQGTHSWLDDILMPAETLPFAWTQVGVAGDYDSGLVTSYADASDHALTWVRLRGRIE